MRKINEFNRSGIWPFTCPDCGKKCTRQNGSSFHKWYNEHFQSLKYQNSNLTFAEHLHGTGHSFGHLHVQIVGRNAPDKMAVHSTSGTMNIFSLSNIRTQLWHLQNTYMVLETHLASRNISGIHYSLSRKENLWIPWKSLIFILKQLEIN